MYQRSFFSLRCSIFEWAAASLNTARYWCSLALQGLTEVRHCLLLFSAFPCKFLFRHDPKKRLFLEYWWVLLFELKLYIPTNMDIKGVRSWIVYIRVPPWWQHILLTGKMWKSVNSLYSSFYLPAYEHCLNRAFSPLLGWTKVVQIFLSNNDQIWDWSDRFRVFIQQRGHCFDASQQY